jgi:polyribonucleotide nucleotidyltransferase
MDFKVAGTADAVTALQLDTKIDGIPSDVLAAALQQAKDARLKILDVMNAAISAPRSTVAESAPKIITFTIPLDKVGEVIGPKGKVINTIQQRLVQRSTSAMTVQLASSPLVHLTTRRLKTRRRAFLPSSIHQLQSWAQPTQVA